MPETTIIGIILSGLLINNFIFMRFLGLCPFLGCSKKMDTAVGMGMAVVFVMVLASVLTWLIYTFCLLPSPNNIVYIISRSFNPNVTPDMFDLVYLGTIAYILVIASLVQFVEMFLQKSIPTLYQSLGIFLPLITTNCAILGLAEINTVSYNYNFIQSLVHAISAGAGFTLALVLMSGLREKMEYADIPKSLQGLPISFITAGLMSLAFMGFSGLKF
jgi:electron transport complex protein RnfA